MSNGMNSKPTSPTGALLLGVSFIALGHYTPALLGSTNAADDLYLGFFKAIGSIIALGGMAGYYNVWRQREKCKASEQPSGIFGEARFATLEDCADAGMLTIHQACISA
ncbi:hypothetical protein ACW9UR_02250 [Halovulum sp. GXIMD14794]